jgi:hypothetical protein
MSHVSCYYVRPTHLILTCLASEGSRRLLPSLLLRWLRVTMDPADVALKTPYCVSQCSVCLNFKSVVVLIDLAMVRATSSGQRLAWFIAPPQISPMWLCYWIASRVTARLPSSHPLRTSLHQRDRQSNEGKLNPQPSEHGTLDAKRVAKKIQKLGISLYTMFLSWASCKFDLYT